jgi:uncharacterized protein with HEPN domain
MQHRDKIILEKIIDAIEVGLKVFNDTPLEKFLKDDGMKLAMAMSVIRVGELVKTLTMDFRENQKQIAWRDIAGFRDIAAHKYDIIDMKILHYTIKNELPELKKQIEKILEHE